MRFETTIEIASPPERVWSTLLDVARWSEWTESVSEIRWASGGDLAVGATARIKQPKMPALRWEVSAVDAGRSFTWWTKSPGVKTVASHALEPLDGGRTRVTLGIDQSGPLAGLVGRLAAGQTRRYIQMEADGLKRTCEA